MAVFADGEIAFGWYGLPQYAALCIRRTRDRMKIRIPVVSTRPSVPIQGMETTLSGDVTWIEESKKYTWGDLGHRVPRLFVVSGWGYPVYNHLTDEVVRNGGKVIVMSDNDWQGNLRQWIGSIYFRIFLRRRFRFAFVPGKSGRRLLRFFGMNESEIHEGMYGGDCGVFNSDIPLPDREKVIVFVGQYIHRKGILPFARAFADFATTHPDWRLELYGCGPMKGEFPTHPNIGVHDFVQPQELSRILGKARALVLPSFVEHWGLVVHEAALSGCALLLSDKIGSRDDLGDTENCLTFPPGDVQSMSRALELFASWNDARLKNAGDVSRRLAAKFGPDAFSASVETMCGKL